MNYLFKPPDYYFNQTQEALQETHNFELSMQPKSGQHSKHPNCYSPTLKFQKKKHLKYNRILNATKKVNFNQNVLDIPKNVLQSVITAIATFSSSDWRWTSWLHDDGGKAKVETIISVAPWRSLLATGSDWGERRLQDFKFSWQISHQLNLILAVVIDNCCCLYRALE